MKATIDNKGTMSVKADNELEAYALAKWAEDYFNPETAGKSILIINHNVPDKPAVLSCPHDIPYRYACDVCDRPSITGAGDKS